MEACAAITWPAPPCACSYDSRTSRHDDARILAHAADYQPLPTRHRAPGMGSLRLAVGVEQPQELADDIVREVEAAVRRESLDYCDAVVSEQPVALMVVGR
jgi:hypothetical protein